jgi:hypothetical protein
MILTRDAGPTTTLMELRLSVIRLHNLHFCITKASNSAVILPLHFRDALSEPQLRILALATPFAPVTITAKVSEDWADGAFPAELVTVETPPRVSAPRRQRKIREGVTVRKRGGGVMLPQ